MSHRFFYRILLSATIFFSISLVIFSMPWNRWMNRETGSVARIMDDSRVTPTMVNAPATEPALPPRKNLTLEDRHAWQVILGFPDVCDRLPIVDGGGGLEFIDLADRVTLIRIDCTKDYYYDAMYALLDERVAPPITHLLSFPSIDVEEDRGLHLTHTSTTLLSTSNVSDPWNATTTAIMTTARFVCSLGASCSRTLLYTFEAPSFQPKIVNMYVTFENKSSELSHSIAVDGIPRFSGACLSKETQTLRSKGDGISHLYQGLIGNDVTSETSVFASPDKKMFPFIMQLTEKEGALEGSYFYLGKTTCLRLVGQRIDETRTINEVNSGGVITGTFEEDESVPQEPGKIFGLWSSFAGGDRLIPFVMVEIKNNLPGTIAGHYVDEDDPNSIIDVVLLEDGKIRVRGQALWQNTLVPNNESDHEGSFEGVAMLNGTHATYAEDYADEEACTVEMDFVDGTLEVKDNNACGGANVSFTGSYSKK